MPIDAAGPGGEIVLSVRSDGSHLVFDVNDTGPGPPPEIADNIFELFVTGKPEGVGFGLALAKQVVEQRQGSLSWERLDNRTHFRLVVPDDTGESIDGSSWVVNLPGDAGPDDIDLDRATIIQPATSPQDSLS